MRPATAILSTLVFASQAIAQSSISKLLPSPVGPETVALPTSSQADAQTSSVVGPQPVGPESAPLTSSQLLPSPVGPETATLSTSLPSPTIIYLPGPTPSNHGTPIVPSPSLTPTPLATSSATDSDTNSAIWTFPIPTLATTFPPSFFASLLGITSCSTDIQPSETGIVDVAGTSYFFLTLGCGTTPFNPFTTAAATATGTGTRSSGGNGKGGKGALNCYPGYGFPASSSHSVSVCCPPGGWSTTTLGPAESGFPNLYCVTSITAAPPITSPSPSLSTPSSTPTPAAASSTPSISTSTTKLLPSPIGPETGISGISAISAASSAAIARRQYAGDTETRPAASVVLTELVYVKAATTTVGAGTSGSGSGTAVGGPVGSPIQAPTSSLVSGGGGASGATGVASTTTGATRTGSSAGGASGATSSATTSASVTAHSSLSPGRAGGFEMGWKGVGVLLGLSLGLVLWAL